MFIASSESSVNSVSENLFSRSAILLVLPSSGLPREFIYAISEKLRAMLLPSLSHVFKDSPPWWKAVRARGESSARFNSALFLML